jgi:hypothetical protein
MAIQFTKATKKQAKLRLALFGPSGSGKTYTALRVATGMGGPIALIDTERGSASKYADRFTLDAHDLEDRSIAGYAAAIRAAQQAGYRVLVIDSLSHAWQELLGEMDRLASAKYRGNTWSAWSEGTPKQRELVDAILAFDGHVMATMRSKTEWTTTVNAKGHTEPVRVGLAPEQGKGIEYEFDMLIELSTEHVANVIKDRTGKFQDRMIDKPGEDLGRDLVTWLESDALPAPEPAKPAASAPTPEPEPKHHWIDNDKVRARWWAYTGKTLGLTNDEVHQALGVHHMAEYTGSMMDAKQAVNKWMGDRVSMPTPQPVEAALPF